MDNDISSSKSLDVIEDIFAEEYEKWPWNWESVVYSINKFEEISSSSLFIDPDNLKGEKGDERNNREKLGFSIKSASLHPSLFAGSDSSSEEKDPVSCDGANKLYKGKAFRKRNLSTGSEDHTNPEGQQSINDPSSKSRSDSESVLPIKLVAKDSYVTSLDLNEDHHSDSPSAPPSPLSVDKSFRNDSREKSPREASLKNVKSVPVSKHANENKVSSNKSRSRSISRDRKRSKRSRSPSQRKERSRHSSREKYSYRDRKEPPRLRKRSRSRESHRRSRSRSYEYRHDRRHRYRSRSRGRHYRRRSWSRSHSRDRSKGSGNRCKPGSLPLSTCGGAMTPQMALQQTMAAMSAKAQAMTGIALPKYYNPAAVNPLKYAEQVQKRKLLWQPKEKVEEQPKNSVWDKLTFAQDQDGKMTAKFRKLMGIKSEGAGSKEDEETTEDGVLKKQEELFRDLDQQYEMARVTTHTQRGVGLGYSNQPLYPPIQKQ